MNPEQIPTKNGVSYEDLDRDFPSLENQAKGSSSGVELSVLTLNVWCLPQPWPVGSKDRKYRLKKLADAILEEKYDIVGLQEIWSNNDYLDMAERLSSAFRYHHYFHSGFTGSGVCVFSRYPIVSTLTHRYSLNGFAHHIHRGDWFGGKVVGLVEIEVGEIRVNFYTTHLHAEYNRENDLYLPHRTSQSFELSQFVRHTSHGADVVIVVGDFNMEPDDLGFR
ncbi:endonuclease/exonuclease/phosphatase family protein [Cooperia oncophora]